MQIANVYCHPAHRLRIKQRVRKTSPDTEKKGKEQQERLIAGRRKESITMEENNRRNEQEDPTPLTDEEFEQFQKKENRKFTIIGDIVDFIVNFFR